MTYYLQTQLTFTTTDEDNTDEAFETFVDAVQDELDKLAELDKGFIDPDLTVGLRDRWIDFLFSIDASSLDDAVRLVLVNLRCALHSAGCNTPGWPTYRPTTETPEVRKAELAEA